MRYTEHAPHPALSRHVRLIWSLELDAPSGASVIERIVPDGVVEIVFHYRTPFAMRFSGDRVVTQAQSFAILQVRRFVEIWPTGVSGFVSVRFQPWGAHHVLRIPLAELADRHLPTTALWGSAARQLEERLALANSTQARVAMVQDFLLARLQHRSARAEQLTKATWQSRGMVRPARLAQGLGISERHLERICRRDLGVSPKGLTRLSRFLHACSALRSRTTGGLAELALKCGYYDQAHFNADFREFAGMTPTQFGGSATTSALDVFS